MVKVASAFCIVAVSSGAALADPVLDLMRGTWRGDGHVFVIDTERMLANSDPERSFQRDPLIIRNISGRMVVFEIDRRRYIGLFDTSELSLTGDGIDGALTLRK
ncbi:hypothetical protein BH10PSE8_BH10PSE8_17890 [soil metagenome]